MAVVQKSHDGLLTDGPIRATVLATPQVLPFLDKVLQLKMQFWPYPLASQRKWVAEHVAAHDLHVLALEENDTLLGYARVTYDEERGCCIVDTVCVGKAAQHRGIGSLVMRAVSGAILAQGRAGLLSCEAGLVGFYARCGWREIAPPLLRADQITMQLAGPATR
jgi:predicted GNAT family N-acyltransferase